MNTLPPSRRPSQVIHGITPSQSIEVLSNLILPQDEVEQEEELNLDKEIEPNGPIKLREAVMAEYQVEAKICSSAFKNTYIFKSKKTGDFAIATRINRANVSSNVIQSFITELRIQCTLRHYSLAIPERYIFPSRTSTNTGLYCVYQSTSARSFKAVCRQFDMMNIFDVNLLKIIIGIVSGISYLHQNGFVHGCIRPSSIFVNKDNDPIIVNYDQPEVYPNDVIGEKELNSKYTAPELLNNYVITEKSDVYAFGILLAKIIFDMDSFHSFCRSGVLPHIPRERRYIIALIKQVLLCINKNPDERPSIFQVEKSIYKLTFIVSQDCFNPVLEYTYNLVKYQPECKVQSQNEVSFLDLAQPTIDSLKKRVLWIKPMVGNEAFDFIFTILTLQCILHTLYERNIKAAIMWILVNIDITDDEIVIIIADEILKACSVQYTKIERIAKVASGLIKAAIDTNALGLIKGYFLDIVVQYAKNSDPYPNSIAHYSLIKELYKMNIYNDIDLANIVRRITEIAPSESFALTAFCWFEEQVKSVYPDIHSHLREKIENEDVREVFKSYLQGEDQFTKLARVIREDKFKKYKKIIKKNPKLAKMPIKESVFDVCPKAHNGPPPLLYAAMYGATKIYVCMQSSSTNFDVVDSNNESLSVMATVGNLGLYFAASSEISSSEQFMTAIDYYRIPLILQNKYKVLFSKNKFSIYHIAKSGNIFAFLLYLSSFMILSEEEIISNLMSHELFGRTVFHTIVNQNNIALLRIFLYFKKADINVTDSWGQTPLHIACVNGVTSVAKIICQLKTTDVNVTDNKENTPLYYAAEKNFADIVSILGGVSKLKPNIQNKKGKTALHIAAKNNSVEAYKQLLSIGCDPRITDKQGKTAYEIAVELNNQEILDVQEEFAANTSCHI